MGEDVFRIVGTPPALSERDRREVAGEIARLQELVRRTPGESIVRVRRNPSGLLGEYVGLLLEATALCLPPRAITPLAVRLRYRRRSWFAVGAESVAAFTAQYAEQLAVARSARREASPES